MIGWSRHRVVRGPFAPVLLAVIAACAARPPPLPAVAFQKPRPGAPWPAGAPPCTIPADASPDLCAPDIEVFRAKGGGAKVARVERAGFVSTVWSELPPAGAARWARVEVHGEGLKLGGWASLDGREFELNQRVDVIPGHVWVPAGAGVEVVGLSGGQVIVSARTSFTTPSSLELAITCDRFGGARSSPPVAAGPPFAVATRGRIDLRASPGGPVALSFDVRSEEQPFVWLERRGDAVRIAGGQPAWMHHPDYTSVLFDGWVSARDVERVESVETWNESGCDPMDLMDRCPEPSVVRDAPVWAGASPGGDAIGTLERGAPIDIVDRRSDFIAFELHNDLIVPPQGMRFWLRAADVAIGCSGPGTPDEENGCPRCEP